MSALGGHDREYQAIESISDLSLDLCKMTSTVPFGHSEGSDCAPKCLVREEDRPQMTDEWEMWKEKYALGESSQAVLPRSTHPGMNKNICSNTAEALAGAAHWVEGSNQDRAAVKDGGAEVSIVLADTLSHGTEKSNALIPQKRSQSPIQSHDAAYLGYLCNQTMCVCPKIPKLSLDQAVMVSPQTVAGNCVSILAGIEINNPLSFSNNKCLKENKAFQSREQKYDFTSLPATLNIRTSTSDNKTSALDSFESLHKVMLDLSQRETHESLTSNTLFNKSNDERTIHKETASAENKTCSVTGTKEIYKDNTEQPSDMLSQSACEDISVQPTKKSAFAVLDGKTSKSVFTSGRPLFMNQHASHSRWQRPQDKYLRNATSEPASKMSGESNMKSRVRYDSHANTSHDGKSKFPADGTLNGMICQMCRKHLLTSPFINQSEMFSSVFSSNTFKNKELFAWWTELFSFLVAHKHKCPFPKLTRQSLPDSVQEASAESQFSCNVSESQSQALGPLDNSNPFHLHTSKSQTQREAETYQAILDVGAAYHERDTSTRLTKQSSIQQASTFASSLHPNLARAAAAAAQNVDSGFQLTQKHIPPAEYGLPASSSVPKENNDNNDVPKQCHSGDEQRRTGLHSIYRGSSQTSALITSTHPCEQGNGCEAASLQKPDKSPSSDDRHVPGRGQGHRSQENQMISSACPQAGVSSSRTLSEVHPRSNCTTCNRHGDKNLGSGKSRMTWKQHGMVRTTEGRGHRYDTKYGQKTDRWNRHNRKMQIKMQEKQAATLNYETKNVDDCDITTDFHNTGNNTKFEDELLLLDIEASELVGNDDNKDCLDVDSEVEALLLAKENDLGTCSANVLEHKFAQLLPSSLNSPDSPSKEAERGDPIQTVSEQMHNCSNNTVVRSSSSVQEDDSATNVQQKQPTITDSRVLLLSRETGAAKTVHFTEDVKQGPSDAQDSRPTPSLPIFSLHNPSVLSASTSRPQVTSFSNIISQTQCNKQFNSEKGHKHLQPNLPSTAFTGADNRADSSNGSKTRSRNKRTYVGAFSGVGSSSQHTVSSTRTDSPRQEDIAYGSQGPKDSAQISPVREQSSPKGLDRQSQTSSGRKLRTRHVQLRSQTELTRHKEEEKKKGKEGEVGRLGSPPAQMVHEEYSCGPCCGQQEHMYSKRGGMRKSACDCQNAACCSQDRMYTKARRLLRQICYLKSKEEMLFRAAIRFQRARLQMQEHHSMLFVETRPCLGRHQCHTSHSPPPYLEKKICRCDDKPSLRTKANIGKKARRPTARKHQFAGPLAIDRSNHSHVTDEEQPGTSRGYHLKRRPAKRQRRVKMVKPSGKGISRKVAEQDEDDEEEEEEEDIKTETLTSKSPSSTSSMSVKANRTSSISYDDDDDEDEDEDDDVDEDESGSSGTLVDDSEDSKSSPKNPKRRKKGGGDDDSESTDDDSNDPRICGFFRQH